MVARKLEREQKKKKNEEGDGVDREGTRPRPVSSMVLLSLGKTRLTISLPVLRIKLTPLKATLPLDWFPWSWTAWSWHVGSRSVVFSPELPAIEEPDEHSLAEPTWSEDEKTKSKTLSWMAGHLASIAQVA